MERLVAEHSAAMAAGRWAAEQIRLESAVTREGVVLVGDRAAFARAVTDAPSSLAREVGLVR